MEGIFVTGTDTDIGKTTICAGLLKLMHGNREAAYWKPIQTGTIVGDDTRDVRALTELNDESYLKPVYSFADPVAPYMAALSWHKEIALDEVTKVYESARRGKFLIVEGAGGLLVPLADNTLQDELIRRLGLSVIIVAADRLGTINQTLLTIRACKEAGISVKGVILTRSRNAPGQGNAQCISKFGEVEILAEFSESSDRRTVVADVSCNPRLRSFFDVPPMP